MRSLIVNDEIVINASASKVWEVLVNPIYVKRWDELPEDYPEEIMGVGSEVIWDLPDGGITKTEVIEAESEKRLVISLSVSGWDVHLKPEDIAYTYTIEEQDEGVKLSFSIGDFSVLPNGRDYYDSSVEFANTAKLKIKQLAEMY
ncbi:SRPBCC family protein [Oceanobacillus massiliensis]|uniref:SRPBCC family protein n=1 Tax=Oceanobacillus massiliensis TaxID=1465765 RepID=UPI00028A0AB7|nr:SRPBCC domain-containing protein [Oceanobacillus massiliensis]